MTTPEELFAGDVWVARTLLGWSQTDLADRLNDAGYRTRNGKPWTQVVVSRFEHTARPIYLDEAFAIARVLGIAVPS